MTMPRGDISLRSGNLHRPLRRAHNARPSRPGTHRARDRPAPPRGVARDDLAPTAGRSGVPARPSPRLDDSVRPGVTPRSLPMNRRLAPTSLLALVAALAAPAAEARAALIPDKNLEAAIRAVLKH